MDKRKYDVHRRIGEIAEATQEIGGKNSLIFLDTCAVLDFEEEIRKRWRLVDHKDARPEKFYGMLLEQDSPIFVTDGVLGEIRKHHENHFLNGHSEISRETFLMMQGLNDDYHEFRRNFLENPDFQALELDRARYDSYFASLFAFEDGHKKCCIDLPSDVDRELVAEALWAKHVVMPTRNDRHSQLITGSVIYSSDAHVSGSCKVLTSKRAIPYGDGFIEAPNYSGLGCFDTSRGGR